MSELSSGTLVRESDSPHWLSYTAGGVDAGGLKIAIVLHRTRRGAIYITDGESLSWDCIDGLGDHWHRTTNEAINLLTPVKITLKDKAVRLRAMKMLGSGLARALEMPNPDLTQDFVADARLYIIDRHRQSLQLWYLAAGAITYLLAIPC